MWWKMGGRFKREGIYVYLWLIYVDVWLKPTQQCKVIILQLKTNTQKTLTIMRSIVKCCWNIKGKLFYCILERKQFTEIESLVKVLLDEWTSKPRNL